MRNLLLLIAALVMFSSVGLWAQERPGKPVDTWVTTTGQAAGTDENAKDEAVAAALRKAVEEACGVFIKGQSRTEDYQAVYDKVLANTAGYVLEYKVLQTTADKEKTTVKVKAHVSTVKFEEEWARMAHTIHQEGNPRVLIAIAEATNWTTTGPSYETKERGTVQSRIEDFFTEKGIQLVDRATAENVSNRDILLASLKDDISQVAALGAKFKADVVVIGTASAKYGRQLQLEGATMHQYNTTLNVRAIQVDSARILASKSFPITSNQVQRNAEDKALAKLADEAAPKLLAAIGEAWRKRATVSRTVELMITGMDRRTWKTFKSEAEKIRGVQNLRLREITESMASIDVEYKFSVDNLADALEKIKAVPLEIIEQNPNRLKAKVVK